MGKLPARLCKPDRYLTLGTGTMYPCPVTGWTVTECVDRYPTEAVRDRHLTPAAMCASRLGNECKGSVVTTADRTEWVCGRCGTIRRAVVAPDEGPLPDDCYRTLKLTRPEVQERAGTPAVTGGDKKATVPGESTPPRKKTARGG